MVRGKVSHKICVGKKVITHQFSGQFSVDIGTIYVGIQCFYGFSAALKLSFALGVLEQCRLLLGIQRRSFQNVGELVTDDGVQSFCRIDVDRNGTVGDVIAVKMLEKRTEDPSSLVGSSVLGGA